MLKLLFNIAVIYAIWQLVRMVTAVSRAQQNMNKPPEQKPNDRERFSSRKSSVEGDYIDYEEIQ